MQILGNTTEPWQPKYTLWSLDIQVKVASLLKINLLPHRKKVTELGQELQTAQFDKVVLSDRILQLQRKLRQTESARDAANAEAIRLRVKLEDLAIKRGEKIG